MMTKIENRITAAEIKSLRKFVNKRRLAREINKHIRETLGLEPLTI